MKSDHKYYYDLEIDFLRIECNENIDITLIS